MVFVFDREFKPPQVLRDGVKVIQGKNIRLGFEVESLGIDFQERCCSHFGGFSFVPLESLVILPPKLLCSLIEICVRLRAALQ